MGTRILAFAALTNAAAQYDPPLSSGSVDPNANGLYQEFLTKLKAAGIGDLLADQNAQLTDWIEANQRK